MKRHTLRVVGRLFLFGFLGLISKPPVFALQPAESGEKNMQAGKKEGKGPVTPPFKKWSGKFSQAWKEVETLQNEQKFEAAAQKVLEILEKARANQNGEEVLKALITTVQFRTALHGYETAVRWLREQPWPEDLLSQTTLELFYAQLLVNYTQVYRWEINQRQRVESKGPVDLKAWTKEQIYAEASAAYERVFRWREQLGQIDYQKLSPYLSSGNYPRGIRPTLRDLVTNLWAALLFDKSGWSPAEQNSIFALDLKSLTGPAEELARHLQATHPLEKLAVALADLEAWHLEARRAEAALDAALERLRYLHSAFSSQADRLLITQALRQRLQGLEKYPWWALGMAELAEWVKEEDSPDALVRARQLALEGMKRFPNSFGGQRCRYIIESIEQPAYTLQGMAQDGPGKPSILIQHKNLSRIFFRAYALDLEKMIAGSKDYNIFPNWQEIEKITKRKPDHQWATALPETTDYRLHSTYITPPIREPGYYLVVASGREDFSQSDNQLVGLNFILTDIVLVARQEGNFMEVTAVSGESGRPLQNVEISLYKWDWQKKHHAVSTTRTGADGRASFSGRNNESYFLFAQKGKHLALDPNYIYLYAYNQPEKSVGSLVYTDRSVYRPGQSLQFKVVAYSGSRVGADFRTLPNTLINITLVDANGQQVATQKLRTGAEGTASGSFDIPSGRLLGQWSLRAEPNGWAPIRVEEYKRPTFEVKVFEAKEPLRLNQPAKITGEARYYFGLPVSSGRANYRVERTPIWPWWWYWWYPGQASATETIESGSSKLKEDGSFEITFTPKADERLAESQPELSYRYRESVEVTDEGGETRNGEKSFRVGFVAIQAAISLENEFLMAGKPSKARIKRTNLDGDPAPGKGSWKLVELAGPEKTPLPVEIPLPDPAGGRRPDELVTPGDRQRPRWAPAYNHQLALRLWADGRQVSQGELEHQKDGSAEFNLGELKPGAYRLHYSSRDTFGKEYRTQYEFIVADSKMQLRLPAVLLVESDVVKVGGTARFLVHSGLEDQQLFIDFYREGKLEKRQRLNTGRDPSLLEIPVTEKMRGGFSLALWLVRDHQIIYFSRTIQVPWDNKELKLEFSSFRDLLRPGQKETWTVRVSGPAGKDAAVAGAEVLAYMYDRSLDIFAPHVPPSPISLFPNFTAAPLTRWTLALGRLSWLPCNGFRQPTGYTILEPASLEFISGYGVGGPGYRRGYYLAAEGRPMTKNAPSPVPAATVPAGKSARQEKKALEFADEAVSGEKDKHEGGKPTPAQEPQAAAAPAVELRTDFSETAFFQPHLLTDKKGAVKIEFQVPDSVTSWNVWVHAITRNFLSGSLKKEARTVKELMVRPYLPRFLREGDTAQLKVVVNNASEKTLSGELTFDIIDPGSEKSLLAEFGLDQNAARGKFSAPAGGSTNLTFGIKTPVRVGLVAIKVVARAGELSDGELRPLPLLPGRMHLMQSRFVTLRGQQKREMRFEDMARTDDPSRIDEQLVVTLDAQLFYSVLAAIPYLVEYPYECTEQLLNRFLSTGILTSLYDRFPAVKNMARKLSQRATRLERFDQPDPNRKIALEETPWLQEAQGGEKTNLRLINVLVPEIAQAHRQAALEKLRKSQTSLGAFPWFPGGPPSPYITLYLLYGFSKGLEFGVEVPKDMIQRAWGYMKRHYVEELVSHCLAMDLCWELVTFLNYTLSNYPDDSWTGGVFSAKDRATMLEFSFRHWKQHSPMLKGYLALTLKRMDREKDARLVWASVMDSAKTAEDQGTFWAPEDRAWLWYNDTIETHAFAVRTELELDPQDPKLDGLVLWLFLNKKLNHWKSTKATAEVIYSLAHYLKQQQQLGVREAARVRVGDLVRDFVFEPDEYTGKGNRVVLPGGQFDPKRASVVTVEKETPGFMLASATWHFSTEKMPEEGRGDFLSLERKFFKREKSGKEIVLKPLAEGTPIEVGDEIEVHIMLRSKHPVGYVHLRDPRPAGCEPVSLVSGHKWNLGIWWYEEVRDSGMNFFFEQLPQGEYPFVHRLRAAVGGKFKVAPATVQPMYAPEFAAYSSGNVLNIRQASP